MKFKIKSVKIDKNCRKRVQVKKQKESVTIADIAKKANVSVTTVSRVINGSDNVKEDTKKKIMQIIEEYNYSPNAFARGLMRKKSNTVGLIIQSIMNPFFAELIAGIENTLYLHGFSLLLCDTEYSTEKQISYVNSLLQQQVRGIIVINQYNINRELISKAAEKTHIISIQSKIPNCDAISCDLKRGMYMSTEHLIKLGHKNIAFICYDRRGCSEKFQGFTQAMNDNDTPVQERYLSDFIKIQTKLPKEETLREAGYIITQKLLQMPVPPTAIQAMNDFYAIGAYHAVMEAGINIPGDISICGFDNVGVSDILNPPLTTVEQFPYEQGKICGELLMQKITEGKNPIPREILLPTSLIIRSSAAPPKK